MNTECKESFAKSSHPLRITLVAAVAKNGVIGTRGRLPWHLPADLRHFKALTWGKPVIMGRRTFESIGRALPGRRNIVLTRDPGWRAPAQVALARDRCEALTLAGQVPEAMVIGGGEIYRLFLPLADRLELTEVDLSPSGDAYFPELDPCEWREVSCEFHEAEGDRPSFRFRRLERRRN
ncbi:MAG: dihydrofolate reductase [Alphaproteobacteria bacterium]|nr:MAG: dihydrofolate reductase [Alphaproteobacteria bacterium]